MPYNKTAPLRGQAQSAAMIDDADYSRVNAVTFNENLAIEELDRLSAQLAATTGLIIPQDPPYLAIGRTNINDSITFHLNNEEYIKITDEGFFVKGVRVAEDRDIYEKFVEWLSCARSNSGMTPINPKPRPKTGPNKFNRYTALTGGVKHERSKL